MLTELCVPREQGHCFRSKDELLEAGGEVEMYLPVGLNETVCSLSALKVQHNTYFIVHYHITYNRRANGCGSIKESNRTKKSSLFRSYQPTDRWFVLLTTLP
jgi:hypothetical protein